MHIRPLGRHTHTCNPSFRCKHNHVYTWTHWRQHAGKNNKYLYDYIYSKRPGRIVAIVAWLQAICDINVWAWEGMPVKLGRWAWLATGYVSEAEMAAFWRVNVSKVGFCGTRKYISSAW